MGELPFQHCPQINLAQRSSTERLRGAARQREALQLLHGVATPVEPWKTKRDERQDSVRAPLAPSAT